MPTHAAGRTTRNASPTTTVGSTNGTVITTTQQAAPGEARSRLVTYAPGSATTRVSDRRQHGLHEGEPDDLPRVRVGEARQPVGRQPAAEDRDQRPARRTPRGTPSAPAPAPTSGPGRARRGAAARGRRAGAVTVAGRRGQCSTTCVHCSTHCSRCAVMSAGGTASGCGRPHGPLAEQRGQRRRADRREDVHRTAGRRPGTSLDSRKSTTARAACGCFVPARTPANSTCRKQLSVSTLTVGLVGFGSAYSMLATGLVP